MPRAPNPKVTQAQELYRQGHKLIEIAVQLEVPAGTVRRWKSDYNWDNERSDKNSERSDRKNKKNNIQKYHKNNATEGVTEVLENPDLTDKQRLFCLYYIRSFNATKSYQKAYDVDYQTAASLASRMMKNDVVKNEIKRLNQNKLNQTMLYTDDIVQCYIDIAFADMSDFVRWTGCEVSVLPSNQVDGALIQEVKSGQNGVSIKLHDKMKALQWLSEYYNAHKEEEQHLRMELLKAQIEKLNHEIHCTDANNAKTHDVDLSALTDEELRRLASYGTTDN